MKFALQIVTALFLLGAAFAASAQEEGPQRWMKIKDQSYMRYADGSGEIEHFASELYFDPAMLGKSTFMLAGYFFPPMPSDREGYKRSGTFKADTIRKVDGRTFEASGVLSSVNGNQRVNCVFTAGFDNSYGEPLLIFDGALEINMTSHASSPHFVNKNPAQVVVEFHIVAKSLPR